MGRYLFNENAMAPEPIATTERVFAKRLWTSISRYLALAVLGVWMWYFVYQIVSSAGQHL